MDGTRASAPPQATTNGISHDVQADSQDLSQVLPALEAIYDPRSTNEIRQAASGYLERAKRLPEAPAYGFNLALDKAHPPQLRYYGLSLLEHAVKYIWEDYSEEQGTALRHYIVQLAQEVNAQEPTYLRNKIAQIWTEIAKRSWAAEWMDMDELLVRLWEASPEHQGLVLYILEMLSEEIFNRDDPVAALRGHELGRACVEIFVPAAVLQEHLPNRDTTVNVRYGDQGWILRLCELLDSCLSGDVEKDERASACAVKTLNAIKAAMPWVMPKAIAATNCVLHIARALSRPSAPVQQAAAEALCAIYNRPHLRSEEFLELAGPMFTPESIRLLREVYEWTLSDMNPNDLNEQKYALCRRLTELAGHIGSFVDSRLDKIPEGSDLSSLFFLLYDMLRNPSLVVSIPVLHVWSKLLRSKIVLESEAVPQLIRGLLETCASRLVRYEALPEDSDEPTLLFLNEDLDTKPEKHAFIGNYRRYCVDVVEVIVRRSPVEATHHILSQADTRFQQLYDGVPPFHPSNFSKSSLPVLRFDAEVTVIDATLKGYLKWVTSHGTNLQEIERAKEMLEDSFEQWCTQMLQIKFDDPEICRKMITLLVTISTRALPTRSNLALKLLEYIIESPKQEDASLLQYTEAVKDLERSCAIEMQRLAAVFPDHFLSVYDDLERKINSILSDPSNDQRQRTGFSAFLLIIVQRCETLDNAQKKERLSQMLDPIKASWQDPAFTSSLSSFESFCNMIGFGNLGEFLMSKNFHKVSDWSTQPLDAEGEALQASISDRFAQLPFRPTRSLLGASTDRIPDDSLAFILAKELWAEAMPAILPNMLQLISHAHAFNNLDSWSHLTPELQSVIRRVLTDRFWQAGISTESRDDFFARVSQSKATYEGFASTVRGTVRQLRETCYFILCVFDRFGDVFYGLPDLPIPLSQALYQNAHALSSHHLSVLLSASTHLIESCPPNLREHFLPPVLQGLLTEVNRKVSAEWAAVTKQTSEGANDNLGDEMKQESILRQLTYSAVSLVSVLLDHQRIEPLPRDATGTKPPSMFSFVLSTPTALEPIIMFIKTCIRVRDSRSCTLAVRILRAELPSFKQPGPVHDFICTEMLKDAITSLHEPYFVDVQKDLAALIADIILLDPEGDPRSIILQLPGMAGKESRVDRNFRKIVEAKTEKMQRAVVLDLLKDVRGLSIQEIGRIERSEPKRKVREEYVTMQEEKTGITTGGEEELAGIADMFA